MSLEITSTGSMGVDYYRSEGRSYNNIPNIIRDFAELTQDYQQFREKSRQLGRRRNVYRARCSAEVVVSLLADEFPVELVIPLNLIDSKTSDLLIIIAENVHLSEVDEWSEIQEYWENKNNSNKQPLERIDRVLNNGFELTRDLREEDADGLAKIWAAFGWTVGGVRDFIKNYKNNPNVWFSGIRDAKGQLVSACEGEMLDFVGIKLVEGTEYGTLPDYEGLGLCTAAVIGLHSQILNDTLYRDGECPLIVSEFNMSSRSDIVGRHTGMTIPFVEGNQSIKNTPKQVLKYNVSVLDRQSVNSIKWSDLGDDRHNFKDAYATPHRYWRNFIVGVLPSSIIEEEYSLAMVNYVMQKYSEHDW